MPFGIDYPKCAECGVSHDPEAPHFANKLDYQMRFFAKHGRVPTYEDAMAHCPPMVADFFRASMIELYSVNPSDDAQMTR